VGRDLSPRLLLDALIRLGPFGDRYLPWRSGFSLAKVAVQAHGVLLAPIRTGVLAKKLRTSDRRVHLWNGRARDRGRAPAPRGGGGRGPAYPLRLIGRRDGRSHNSWLHNLPKLMRGERCRRLRIAPETPRASACPTGIAQWSGAGWARSTSRCA